MLVALNIGYIPIGAIAYITILTIPVMVGAIFCEKWYYGLILGTVFGLSSMIYSFIIPGVGGVNAPFTNPLLSVLPRSLFGLIIFPVYKLFYKNIKVDYICIVMTVLVCQLFHSILVLATLYIVGSNGFFFYANDFPYLIDNNILMFVIAGFGLNGLIETIVACVVTTPIYLVLKKIFSKYENDF